MIATMWFLVPILTDEMVHSEHGKNEAMESAASSSYRYNTQQYSAPRASSSYQSQLKRASSNSDGLLNVGRDDRFATPRYNKRRRTSDNDHRSNSVDYTVNGGMYPGSSPAVSIRGSSGHTLGPWNGTCSIYLVSSLFLEYYSAIVVFINS